jgi:hypothetical protein
MSHEWINAAKKLHREAVREVSRSCRCWQEREKSLRHLRSAYALERRAAELLRYEVDAEPVRSRLFESAAALAWEIGEFTEAEVCAREVTRGHPAPEVRQRVCRWLEVH